MQKNKLAQQMDADIDMATGDDQQDSKMINLQTRLHDLIGNRGYDMDDPKQQLHVLLVIIGMLGLEQEEIDALIDRLNMIRSVDDAF